MPVREELKHVRQIRGIRIARPGAMHVSLSLDEARKLPERWADDDGVREHVEALAKAVTALQEQGANVGIELLSRY